MLNPSGPSTPEFADRLPLPWADEAAQAKQLERLLRERLDWSLVRQRCQPWVEALRRQPAPFWALESLLHEFPLSGAQGLALMRLAEALLRVPDQASAQALLQDQLAQGRFDHHVDSAPHSAHPLLAGASTRVLAMAQQFMAEGTVNAAAHTALQHWSGAAVVAAASRALQLLGRQFVLGESLDQALPRAQDQARTDAAQGLLTSHSFDMLGEGARTWADAERHLAAYQEALERLSSPGGASPAQLAKRPGLSIKLSALHPRFEPAQHGALLRELLPRLQGLIQAAARGGVVLTLDAEESFRLELQLDLLMRLVRRAPGPCEGLGLAIQAYQHRAGAMIDEVQQLAKRHGQRLSVRLVKGAYWDSEIKRAQELGLPGYPVYTRKTDTDLSYLACADTLLAQAGLVYPQFATHNAATIAAVMELASQRGVRAEHYEWQRLHGMGEGIYRQARAHQAGPPALRIYAPVGPHRDLLAYLVRRLLENGANASFVHQLADPATCMDELLRPPWPQDLGSHQQPPALALPRHIAGPERLSAAGRDLNCQIQREALQAAVRQAQPRAQAACRPLSPAEAQAHMTALHSGWPAWEDTPLPERCAILERVAAHLEGQLDGWAADLVTEARKTLGDAVAEVRETIDLARYYAQQARLELPARTLPGPTGECNVWRWRSRGVFVCISPWNFPLAIFGGQIMAALVSGNAVAAKPAEQTPHIAQRLVALLHRCGVPTTALACIPGPGSQVGAALIAHAHCAGVAFTGSVGAAKTIQRALALADHPLVPLIAETGGLNAMVVDSTALPEQVIDAVIGSAFLSAGQRCSCLRLLCLHTGVAEPLETMLAGALRTLRVGDPADWSSDLGPVIDAAAHSRLSAHLADLAHQAQQVGSGVRLIGQADLDCSTAPALAIAPTAYALPGVSALTHEHFGPILHVVRWGPGTAAPDLDALIEQINATGFGLTLGIQTRIDGRAQYIARRVRVGNVYVNRGMTGAVVGSQPFGGQGWSGSGPKAGGPNYLQRFCFEQAISTNTAAAGGNAALLTQTQ